MRGAVYPANLTVVAGDPALLPWLSGNGLPYGAPVVDMALGGSAGGNCGSGATGLLGGAGHHFSGVVWGWGGSNLMKVTVNIRVHCFQRLRTVVLLSHLFENDRERDDFQS